MAHGVLARLPVRLRLTLWYVVLLAAALAVFSGTVYVLLSRNLENGLDTSLHQRINQLLPAVDVSNGHMSLPVTTEEPDVPAIPTLLLSSSGTPVSGRAPSALRGWLRHHGPRLPSAFHATTAGDLRVATAPIDDSNHQLGYLLVWQSLNPVNDALRSLLLLMLLIGPVLLLVAGSGGMLLARRAFVPVTQITHAASNISATDLHRRVPVSSARDELSELAATFNAMIERLEGAVERERRFTGDASHELRSPLAVIMAEASLALEEPVGEAEYRRALQAIGDQATGMHGMIAELLTLARVETIADSRETVPLAHVAERAIRQCALVASERGVHISGHVASDLFAEGSEMLLTRAARNLFDNAVKASPAGATVRYWAVSRRDTVELSIGDEGPGVPPDDLERIFEPFYQVEKARTPGDSHGLGLAICRRIARAHGGEVTVESEPGKGATFTLVLPAAQ